MPAGDPSDVEAAQELADQVAALMVAVSTGGPAIDEVNDDYQRKARVLAQLEISPRSWLSHRP